MVLSLDIIHDAFAKRGHWHLLTHEHGESDKTCNSLAFVACSSGDLIEVGSN